MMFSIFPCGADKRPLIKNWQKLATKDPDQIKEWTERFGKALALWSIPTGESNDILVLDVDVKDDNGFETLKTLDIPITMKQCTPSGGAHYIYKYPNGGDRYTGKIKFLKGLDVRADGNYICYYGTDATPVTECPSWLVDATRAVEYDTTGVNATASPPVIKEAIEKAIEVMRDASEGERNHTLNIEMFKLGKLGVTEERAHKELLSVTKEIGMSDGEVCKTIASGIKDGNNTPITCPFTDSTPVIEIPAPPEPEGRWTPGVMSMSDLFNTKCLRKPQIFENWSTEDIHITVADGGTGKTTLKLYEAVCLALGERFLGFNCLQPGEKTLYITGEDTEFKLIAMVGQILKTMGFHADIGKCKTVLDSIRIKKDDSLCLISKDGSQFLGPNYAAMDRILEAVHDIQPKMIVIDPIASFWGSESLVNDMGKAVSKFASQLVYESNACVEMINHAGKVSSAGKDMTQFAGRGGTGLVSHARVARVMRSIDDKEYTEVTNKELDDNESALICNVSKFSDGSPLFNKPFVIVRRGFGGFYPEAYDMGEAKEQRKDSDIQRVLMFVNECRQSGKYPTKPVIIGNFMTANDKMSAARSKSAIDMLMFAGVDNMKLAITENPNALDRERVYIITDTEGKEVTYV